MMSARGPVTSLSAQHRYGWRWGYSGSADTLEITRLTRLRHRGHSASSWRSLSRYPLIPLSAPDTSSCHAQTRSQVLGDATS